MLAESTIEAVRHFWAGRFDIDDAEKAPVRAVRGGDAISVVRIGDATFAVAPESCAPQVSALAPEARVDVDRLESIAGDRARALGIAHLAYADNGALHRTDDCNIEPIDDEDTRLFGLAAACGAAEWLEASMDHPVVRRFGLFVDDDLVACAGYEDWDGTIAQLDVIVHPAQRGRGYARHVGAHAAAVAIDAGLVAQWRSSFGNAASTAVG